MKSKNLIQTLKSTRLIRTLIPLSFIFLTTATANTINTEIIILSISCILLYASGGILNATTDKDFKIRSAKKIFYTLIIITILISFHNKIILTTVILWIILNILYNKYSRKTLLTDTAILSLTHAILPILATAAILNLNIQTTFSLATFALIQTNLIFPMKNLNGIKEDKKRKYKTILTQFKYGKTITSALYNISAIALLIKTQSILLIFPLTTYILTNIKLNQNQKTEAYETSRLTILTTNLILSTQIILPHLIILTIYTTHLLQKWNTTTS